MVTKKFLSAASIVFALALLTSTTNAGHSWNNYHWARTSSPFTLKVVDSVNADWQAEFENSLSQWGASDVLDLSVARTDESNKARKRCTLVAGQMRVCNAAYGRNGWLGRATIGLDSNGHIDQGKAQVNDSYSSSWLIPGEKNHVMCQEIGHVFGLGHTSVNGTSQGTCMDYSTDLSSQWPNAHDHEQLATIYNDHLDSYNSFDGESSGGGDGGGGCNAPPGKGCNKMGSPVPMGVLVHRGPGHEIWVASRPDGGLWIHHVRLAPRPGTHQR